MIFLTLRSELKDIGVMGHCQDNGSVLLYGSGGEMRDDFCGPEHSLSHTHTHTQ